MKQELLRTGISWLVLLVFMGVFQPDGLPVVLLIVPFILLFTALLSLWNLLQAVYRRYFARSSQTKAPKRLGITVCSSVVILIILQSLGQLTLKDVGSVVAIAALGYLYVARNRSGLVRH